MQEQEENELLAPEDEPAEDRRRAESITQAAWEQTKLFTRQFTTLPDDILGTNLDLWAEDLQII